MAGEQVSARRGTHATGPLAFVNAEGGDGTAVHRTNQADPARRAEIPTQGNYGDGHLSWHGRVDT